MQPGCHGKDADIEKKEVTYSIGLFSVRSGLPVLLFSEGDGGQDFRWIF